jgi:hypothetical protein
VNDRLGSEAVLTEGRLPANNGNSPAGWSSRPFLKEVALLVTPLACHSSERWSKVADTHGFFSSMSRAFTFSSLDMYRSALTQSLYMAASSLLRK